MGHFDRTTCDCCVCPMQCVMQQLVGQTDVAITTPVGDEFNVTINSVDNFIADTSAGLYAICNVTAVASDALGIDTKLKPVRQDKKGECSCCEDPATNELIKLINQEVGIEFITNSSLVMIPGTVLKVGEGIVISELVSSEKIAISTCQVTRIDPDPA
ncbi:hypothetical protein [Chengkuizengella sediminis]|uniref:hypothetical protein n=1 Tax=Chengkuizengella sediminis TaxID=1885917 RepID=UPI001389CB77|nr:hypothetical protein [Chengkuizengella sediminis]NDI33556.1 hypothetical protein [Chengkuizengella sediminis]